METEKTMQGIAGTISPNGGVSTLELFEQAVKDHSRRLHAIARAIVGNRASPEDVVQQAVMNLFRHRDRYDWREPGGLLKRATVNEALRLLRRPKMAQVAEDGMVFDDSNNAPDASLEQSETTQRVRQAIDNLPENFRAALVLCEYEEMPYAEIATTLGASVPQVKTWIFRARRKLEAELRDYYQGISAKERTEIERTEIERTEKDRTPTDE
jgi:RNA polymerase sigma factor (sigma-70 family)